jgi:hypothetical protein
VWFFYKNYRVDPRLFSFKASSQFGTILGPLTDTIGDYFGVANLANDGDLRTAFRSYFSVYWYRDETPTLTISAAGSTRFDRIVVYNRRYARYQRRDAGATIRVVDSANTTLWQSVFVGAKLVYNFTNVISGPLLASSSSSSSPPSSSPSFSSSSSSSSRHYEAASLATRAPTFSPSTLLVTTISKFNISYVHVGEVWFYRGGQKLDPTLFSFSCTSVKVDEAFDDYFGIEGGPEYANDGKLDTYFLSENTESDDDLNPTLIITTAPTNTFDTIIVGGKGPVPLSRAKLNIFYLTGSTRKYIWNTTFVDDLSFYSFSVKL